MFMQKFLFRLSSKQKRIKRLIQNTYKLNNPKLQNCRSKKIMEEKIFLQNSKLLCFTYITKRVFLQQTMSKVI